MTSIRDEIVRAIGALDEGLADEADAILNAIVDSIDIQQCCHQCGENNPTEIYHTVEEAVLCQTCLESAAREALEAAGLGKLCCCLLNYGTEHDHSSPTEEP